MSLGDFDMLSIENVIVKVKDKVILKDFNLCVAPGEIHALMGANGAGKSTIAKVLLRDTNYETSGNIFLNGKDLLAMNTTEVARSGVFLVQQNPLEIAGVSNALLIRTSLQEQGKDTSNVLEFNRKMTALCEKLQIPTSFVHRDVNFNMSGGEKKKNELLHMRMLEPSFLILDEIDSGLDVDALKLVSHSILEYYQKYKPSILVITHQKSLLSILKPTQVPVLNQGKIIKSGDYSLAEKIFEEGFSGAGVMASSDMHE